MPLRPWILLALFACVSVPFGARAQCAEGRVQSEQTAGRCCWPGQSWNDERGRCEGPPQCPSGWVAEGDSCVAARGELDDPSVAPENGWSGRLGGSTQAPLPDYGARLGGSSSQPTATGEQWWGSAPHSSGEPQVRQVRESLKPLWATGLVMMAIGYVYSIIAGAIFVSLCCDPDTSWTMFIPLVGGYIWPATTPNYSSIEELMGIPGAGVQTLGLILAIIGAAAQRTRTVPAYSELAPQITAGPGQLGLSLTWEL